VQRYQTLFHFTLLERFSLHFWSVLLYAFRAFWFTLLDPDPVPSLKMVRQHKNIAKRMLLGICHIDQSAGKSCATILRLGAQKGCAKKVRRLGVQAGCATGYTNGAKRLGNNLPNR